MLSEHQDKLPHHQAPIPPALPSSHRTQDAERVQCDSSSLLPPVHRISLPW